MSPDDARVPRARDLKRMKAIALALLLGAAALLCLSHYMGRTGAWGWLGAFAEAAMVGALADWFAVVALFRHPLGLPIKHTAIIPANKDRIARALADFVANHFLAPQQIVAKIGEWNPAARLGTFLSEPASLQRFSRQLQSWARASLGALDAPELERELLNVVREQLIKWDMASTAAQLVRALTEGEHHQRVLNAGLVQVGKWIDQPAFRTYISEKLADMARREFPKLTWLVDKLHSTDELADALGGKLANALIDELQSILNTPDHPLRARYAQEAARLMTSLEQDPDVQAKVAAFKRQLLESDALNDYVRHLWRKMRDWLQADLSRDDATSMRYFRDYAARVGHRLRDDPRWQRLANDQMLIAADHLAGVLRAVAPGYIVQTIEAWDTRFLVEEIERSVGVDLQYIRFNGTLIGGLVGLLLYGFFRLPWFH